MRYYKHRLNEGFADAFDNDLTDYSSGYEKADNDYLYQPAKELAENRWNKFISSFGTKDLRELLTTSGNYVDERAVKLTTFLGLDGQPKGKHTEIFPIDSLTWRSSSNPYEGDHSGKIVFHIEDTRTTGTRIYGGNLMIEFYVNGNKIYEYPKIIKFSIWKTSGYTYSLVINKEALIFKIIETTIKDLFLESGVYNYYIDDLMQLNGTVYPVEKKDWDRMEKCIETNKWDAFKLIKDKRKAVARFVTGWILNNPGKSLRNSYEFYTESRKSWTPDYGLYGFYGKAKELGATDGDILSSADEAVKNKPAM